MNAVSPGRRVVGTVAAVCFTLVVSACSVVAPGSVTGSSIPNSATRHPASPSAPAVAVVAHPWRPGMPQLGINVAWSGNSRDHDDVIRAKSQRIIDYAISLKANSIAVTIPFYTGGITSDTLYVNKVTTPSPQHIAIFLSVAAEAHIRVTIRPVLNENILVRQNPIAWRGSIEPASLSAWFAAYRKLLLPYARVAQSGHAATFVIGTELNSLEGASEWPSLVRAITAVYHGQVTYDENFDSFQNHDTNLPVTDFGVDAYPRFQLPDSASVSDLTQAWENWLSSHSSAVLHRAVLSEVGITATPGAYQLPGAWQQTTHAPIVPQIQARWYKAVCNAVSADKLAGMYWWEVSFDADPVHPAAFLTDRLTFLARPAQKEISSCFAALTAEETSSS
jgi:hypothetical protein